MDGSNDNQPDDSEIKKLLSDLGADFDRIRTASFGLGLFRLVLRAALVKAFEFAVAMQGEQAKSFFLTATLRGICEDFIALSFIAPFDDRDDMIKVWVQRQLAEGLRSQHEFFSAERPWQPTLGPSTDLQNQLNANSVALARRHGWPSGRFPKVIKMAEATGNLPLYHFIYSATSKWVHFSPHVLFRMGWTNGHVDLEALDETTTYEFSTGQFSRYYEEFNRIYAVFLLAVLADRFAEEFEDPNKAKVAIASLKSRLRDCLRWPEAVTFEEMNAKEPGALLRILLRAAHDTAGGDLSRSKSETPTGLPVDPEEPS